MNPHSNHKCKKGQASPSRLQRVGHAWLGLVLVVFANFTVLGYFGCFGIFWLFWAILGSFGRFWLFWPFWAILVDFTCFGLFCLFWAILHVLGYFGPIIFRMLIYGGFGILMSQYGQLTKNLTIQGCAKIVFSLHTARTENPYAPKIYSSASNFHKCHADTPRHPSDSSQTPPDIPREH